MFIKVCGITRLEDALEAARLGFDAIGLVFAESPRRVDPEQARAICGSAPAGLVKVGVFVNEERARGRRLADYCGLDLLQFHGEEDASYVSAFAKRAIRPSRRGRISRTGPSRSSRAASPSCIDARDAERRGGTGRLADWKTAARLARRHPVILAGGLTPRGRRGPSA